MFFPFTIEPVSKCSFFSLPASLSMLIVFLILALNYAYNMQEHSPGEGRSGEKPWFPHFNFRTKQGPKIFQFQTSGILLFTGAQKIYRPEISRFLPCMLHFLDNLRRFFIFSNCIREKDDV